MGYEAGIKVLQVHAPLTYHFTGIGMWAIIYPGIVVPSEFISSNDFKLTVPVCSLPLLACLTIIHKRAKRAGALASYKTPYQLHGSRRLAVALFWQLDVIGIVLLISVFSLLLVPFTIAGGSQLQWKTAKVIVPLVLGILLIPVWIIWEMKCEHPMVPFKVRHADLPNNLLGHAVSKIFILDYSFLKTALSGVVWALRSHSIPVSGYILCTFYLGHTTNA
jgi:SIT family siderophore-iron:H+ symporter-like MFS transporter